MKILVAGDQHETNTFAPSKTAGPMAADPADLPWEKLAKTTRTRP